MIHEVGFDASTAVKPSSEHAQVGADDSWGDLISGAAGVARVGHAHGVAVGWPAMVEPGNPGGGGGNRVRRVAVSAVGSAVTLCDTTVDAIPYSSLGLAARARSVGLALGPRPCGSR